MGGLFLSFEGGEGAGKSTQIARLAEWLKANGQIVCVTRQPGGSIYGQRMRELILAPSDAEQLSDRAELLLYLADRAQHVDAVLKPALARSEVVLCDRYADSSLAYQGYGRGLDLTELRQLNTLATQGLQPHLTFWFDLPPHMGHARIAKRGSLDRLEAESMSFHQRVHEGYASLAALEPQRWRRLEAQQSEASLQSTLREWIQPLLPHPVE